MRCYGAQQYPHILVDSERYGVMVRASPVYGGGGCTEFFDVLVGMEIDAGKATATGSFPSGIWSDSEGFLDQELEAIARHIQRRYYQFLVKLYGKEKV